MRKLKFRVWDSKQSKFENPDQCGLILRYGLIHGTEKHPIYNVYYNPNMIIQQYTGLDGKNGIEIYEGDILSHKGRIGTVSYNTDSGGFILEYEYSGREQNYENLTCDVAYESPNIGNVFENKDLLK